MAHNFYFYNRIIRQIKLSGSVGIKRKYDFKKTPTHAQATLHTRILCLTHTNANKETHTQIPRNNICKETKQRIQIIIRINCPKDFHDFFST